MTFVLLYILQGKSNCGKTSKEENFHGIFENFIHWIAVRIIVISKFKLWLHRLWVYDYNSFTNLQLDVLILQNHLVWKLKQITTYFLSIHTEWAGIRTIENNRIQPYSCLAVKWKLAYSIIQPTCSQTRIRPVWRLFELPCY